jgi:hypothetical protein
MDTMTENEPVAMVETEEDVLDSALDPDLDQYCIRMRSETGQGDEITIRDTTLVLRIKIQVLELNPTTGTIMSLIYPGTPPIDTDEGLGNLNPPGLDDQGLQITIAHYVDQHGGEGHYNPIIQQDEKIDSLEETDIPEGVEDDERSHSGSSMHLRDYEDSLVIDTEKPESLDQTHPGDWTVVRAAAAAEKKEGLQQFQTTLRQKLTPNVWTSSGTLDQWLSGRSRRQPCRKLAILDPVKIREWIVPDHLTSFIQKCPFVIWM